MREKGKKHRNLKGVEMMEETCELSSTVNWNRRRRRSKQQTKNRGDIYLFILYINY